MILTSNDRLLVVTGHKICVAFCGYGTNCCSDSDATCVRYCRSSIGGRHTECKSFAECNLHKSYWKLFSEEEAFIILKSDYRRLSYLKLNHGISITHKPSHVCHAQGHRIPCANRRRLPTVIRETHILLHLLPPVIVSRKPLILRRMPCAVDV